MPGAAISASCAVPCSRRSSPKRRHHWMPTVHASHTNGRAGVDADQQGRGRRELLPALDLHPEPVVHQRVEQVLLALHPAVVLLVERPVAGTVRDPPRGAGGLGAALVDLLGGALRRAARAPSCCPCRWTWSSGPSSVELVRVRVPAAPVRANGAARPAGAGGAGPRGDFAVVTATQRTRPWRTPMASAAAAAQLARPHAGAEPLAVRLRALASSRRARRRSARCPRAVPATSVTRPVRESTAVVRPAPAHHVHARPRVRGWPARRSSAPLLAPEAHAAEPAPRHAPAGGLAAGGRHALGALPHLQVGLRAAAEVARRSRRRRCGAASSSQSGSRP